MYDPVERKTYTAAPLLKPRGNTALVALPNERLMVVGGRTYVDSQAVVRASLRL